MNIGADKFLNFQPNFYQTAKSIFRSKKGSAAWYNKNQGYLRQHTEGDESYIGPEGVKKELKKKERIGSRSIIKFKAKGFEGTSKHRELKVYTVHRDSVLHASYGNVKKGDEGNVWIIKTPSIGTGRSNLVGSLMELNSLRFRIQITNVSTQFGTPNTPIPMDYRIIVFSDKTPPYNINLNLDRMDVSDLYDISGEVYSQGLLGSGPINLPSLANLFDINPVIGKRVKILYDETFVVGPYGFGQMRTHELDLNVKGLFVKTALYNPGVGVLTRAIEGQLCMAIIPNFIDKFDNGVVVSALATVKYYN